MEQIPWHDEFITANNSHKSAKCITYIAFNIGDFPNVLLASASGTNKNIPLR